MAFSFIEVFMEDDAEPITGTNGSIKRINPERLKQFRDKF